MSAEAIESPRRLDYRGASPWEVRAALVPEEQPDFDRQWQQAMAEATKTLDLAGVFKVLESWRRRAMTTAALGHADYRRMLTQAENTLLTGEPPPGTVPLEDVKAYLAERLGR